MRTEQLTQALFANQDAQYRQMQIRLLPNLSPDTIIGVRTPVLRELAKALEDGEVFLQRLPHCWFEENQVHAFLLEREKDFDAVIRNLDAFLPFVDNWATCDQLRPRCFQKHRKELLPHIQRWIASEEPFTVRFGIGMLMVHYLDADFDPACLEWVASVRTDEYYVQMMIAWYFATALAKQYEASLPYISECRLEKWTHNKSIQKAVESFRVLPEHKEVLKKHRI